MMKLTYKIRTANGNWKKVEYTCKDKSDLSRCLEIMICEPQNYWFESLDYDGIIYKDFRELPQIAY